MIVTDLSILQNELLFSNFSLVAFEFQLCLLIMCSATWIQALDSPSSDQPRITISSLQCAELSSMIGTPSPQYPAAPSLLRFPMIWVLIFRATMKFLLPSHSLETTLSSMSSRLLQHVSKLPVERRPAPKPCTTKTQPPSKHTHKQCQIYTKPERQSILSATTTRIKASFWVIKDECVNWICSGDELGDELDDLAHLFHDADEDVRPLIPSWPLTRLTVAES